MAKICNQTFVKDKYRDRNFIGTMKCMACNEESHISLKFPCSLIEFNKQVKGFSKLHAIKGCNKVKVDKVPKWACKSFTIGIAN